MVTGTFVGPKGTSPSNKSHRKMKSLLEALHQAESSAERLAIIRSLIGLTNHFLTTFSDSSDAHQRLKGRLAWLHNERRAAEAAVSSPSSHTLAPEGFDDGSVPW